ncbi:hypothetical protein HPG69_004681 [Diceros bicornis minor]|uniref:Uncharacterized protein n=1 Tax=Diceros bicornis minor TaxID=77932 RepID=A0A7J7E4K9_DICBM|nr:hypothetical protein HPG69_004681 [Diceros bicornis minor]
MLDMKKRVTDMQPAQQNESKTNKKLRQKVNRKTEIISETFQIHEDNDKVVPGQESYTKDLGLKIDKSKQRLECQVMTEGGCQAKEVSKMTSRSKWKTFKDPSPDGREVMDTLQGVSVDCEQADKETNLENEKIVTIKPDFYPKIDDVREKREGMKFKVNQRTQKSGIVIKIILTEENGM